MTGGLIGSAFFGSLQLYFAHKNFESLTQNIVVTDPLISGEMNTLFSPSYGAPVPHGLGSEQGTSLLIEKFKLTANIFAYDDVFRLYFYISMIVFIIFLVTMVIKSCSLRALEK